MREIFLNNFDLLDILSVGREFVCFSFCFFFKVPFSGILSPPFRIKVAKCLGGNKRVPYDIWMTRTVVVDRTALRRFSTAKRTKLQPPTPEPVSFYPLLAIGVKKIDDGSLCWSLKNKNKCGAVFNKQKKKKKKKKKSLWELYLSGHVCVGAS